MVDVSAPSSEGSLGSPYAGARLGLPEEGPGSVAGWGRRVAALTIDWIACLLVSALFIGSHIWSPTGGERWLTMAIFLFEATVLTALLGGSFGQLAMRVVVGRLDGRSVNLAVAFVRTLLICLVVPPLIFNRDQRGLHDMVAKTVTLKR